MSWADNPTTLEGISKANSTVQLEHWHDVRKCPARRVITKLVQRVTLKSSYLYRLTRNRLFINSRLPFFAASWGSLMKAVVACDCGESSFPMRSWPMAGGFIGSIQNRSGKAKRGSAATELKSPRAVTICLYVTRKPLQSKSPLCEYH